MSSRILEWILQTTSYRGPFRPIILRKLMNRCPWPLTRHISYSTRLKVGAVDRPYYGYCMYAAAKLAKRLGHKAISVLEFGVAGGNGLLAIERNAREIGREIGIEFEIYGFDGGTGLPLPSDYRDLPYQWQGGFFSMDQESLRAKLRTSKLVIGNVRETCRSFFENFDPAPIGCIFFDLDYYSSTIDSFQIFEAEDERFLPRMFLYFDDIIGSEMELHSDFTGERLAIFEFNEESSRRKISPAYHLTAEQYAPVWHHQVFVCHSFDHPEYCSFVGPSHQQLPLAGTGSP